jgi:hypothetical protein
LPVVCVILLAKARRSFIVQMPTPCVKCGGKIAIGPWGPYGRFFTPDILEVTGADVPGWWCYDCCVAGTDDEEE